jgi:hypothetical protein
MILLQKDRIERIDLATAEAYKPLLPKGVYSHTLGARLLTASLPELDEDERPTAALLIYHKRIVTEDSSKASSVSCVGMQLGAGIPNEKIFFSCSKTHPVATGFKNFVGRKEHNQSIEKFPLGNALSVPRITGARAAFSFWIDAGIDRHGKRIAAVFAVRPHFHAVRFDAGQIRTSWPSEERLLHLPGMNGLEPREPIAAGGAGVGGGVGAGGGPNVAPNIAHHLAGVVPSAAQLQFSVATANPTGYSGVAHSFLTSLVHASNIVAPPNDSTGVGHDAVCVKDNPLFKQMGTIDVDSCSFTAGGQVTAEWARIGRPGQSIPQQARFAGRRPWAVGTDGSPTPSFSSARSLRVDRSVVSSHVQTLPLARVKTASRPVPFASTTPTCRSLQLRSGGMCPSRAGTRPKSTSLAGPSRSTSSPSGPAGTPIDFSPRTRHKSRSSELRAVPIWA